MNILNIKKIEFLILVIAAVFISEYLFSGSKFFKKQVANKQVQENQLELFADWMREDPLLFDPYMNIEKYDEAVSRYQNSMNVFLETIGGSKISPTDFMEKFKVSSQRYNEFQNSKTEENARFLIASIKDTQKAYINDVIEIKKSFQSLQNSPDSSKKIAFLGGETETDLSIIMGDLDLIQKNGENLKTEIVRREKCLLDSVKYCEKPVDEFKKYKVDSKEFENGSPQLLSKEILGIPVGSEVRGLYEINSSCWNKRSYQWLYAVVNCDNEKSCFSEPFLADNKYYSTLGDSPTDKSLLELGVQLRPMGVSTPYSCNDLSYRATFYTVDYFFENFKDSRISGKINLKRQADDLSREMLNKLVRAERDFFDSDIKSQYKLKKLGEANLLAYSYFKDNYIIDESELLELLRFGLMEKEKMINTHQVINGLSVFIERLNARFLEIGSNPPLIYLYTTKSAYSVLFYSFAPSVWRIDQRLHLLDVGNKNTTKFNMNESSFMQFHEASKMYGEEKLIDWIKIYKNIREE